MDCLPGSLYLLQVLQVLQVNQKIEEITGLTAEQFNKIALIAQGEFQELVMDRTAGNLFIVYMLLP